MEITKENLIIHFGMKETEGEDMNLFPLKKVISLPSECLEETEEMAIAVTTMRNRSELCMIMPDGALMYLTAESIEDLIVFEKSIGSYEPNF